MIHLTKVEKKIIIPALPKRTPLLPPQKPKGITVTVCVASICEKNILFGASDRMLTSGDVEFEPQTPKIYNLTNSIAVMIAGDASLQTMIVQALFQYAVGKITANPKEWVPIPDIAQEYYRIYQRIRSERAEARLLTPLGLTLETFRAQQRSLLDSMAGDITKEILNFDMPSIEAIIAGLDTMGAHIYVINNGGINCQDAIGFAAIGIGYWHANSQFMFAKHNRDKPLAQTLLLTYAAKKRAEVAPGVGVGTDMFTIGPFLGSYSALDSAIVNSVDGIYTRTRARAEKSVKKSNDEVTKYVEQLGKAAMEQQQGSPTPQPEDKPNGKEGDGKEGSARTGEERKPN